MGQLTFQATLGGAVNLVGPNTASTTSFTLPAADGTSGQFLSTNGSGTLSFASQVYPGAGIPNSTGTAWGTSYTTTGSGTVIALATTPKHHKPNCDQLCRNALFCQLKHSHYACFDQRHSSNHHPDRQCNDHHANCGEW